MAQRVQEGAQMPLLQDKHGQSRLNNPSSTGAKQYLVGSTDLPCWFSAHVYVGWAALSFDPAGRTVTRSQLLFAPDTWSPLSWRQRSSHCVQDAPWLVSSAILWFSSTFAVIAREAGSAGPFIGGCRAHEIS